MSTQLLRARSSPCRIIEPHDVTQGPRCSFMLLPTSIVCHTFHPVSVLQTSHLAQPQAAPSSATCHILYSHQPCQKLPAAPLPQLRLSHLQKWRAHPSGGQMVGLLKQGQRQLRAERSLFEVPNPNPNPNPNLILALALTVTTFTLTLVVTRIPPRMQLHLRLSTSLLATGSCPFYCPHAHVSACPLSYATVHPCNHVTMQPFTPLHSPTQPYAPLRTPTHPCTPTPLPLDAVDGWDLGVARPYTQRPFTLGGPLLLTLDPGRPPTLNPRPWEAPYS